MVSLPQSYVGKYSNKSDYQIRELNRFVSSKDKNTDYVFACEDFRGHCIQMFGILTLFS